MKSSSRFAVSVHLLCAMAWMEQHGTPMLTSSKLADSVNTNAVVVRRLLGSLAKAGLVVTHSGQGGGSCLGKSADEITLGEIYRAVEDEAPFHMHYSEPNDTCPVGRNIREVLSPYVARATRAMVGDLDQSTLARVLDDVVTREASGS